MGHQTTNSPSSAIERIYGVVPQGWPCAKKKSKMGRNGRDEGEAGGRMSRRRRVSESRRKKARRCGKPFNYLATANGRRNIGILTSPISAKLSRPHVLRPATCSGGCAQLLARMCEFFRITCDCRWERIEILGHVGSLCQCNGEKSVNSHGDMIRGTDWKNV